MNILVISEFFPNNFRKHEGIFVFEQVKCLKSNNIINVIAPINRYLPLRRYQDIRINGVKIKKIENIEGITIYRPKTLNWPVIGELFVPYLILIKILFYVIYHRIKFEIIHCHWAYRAGFVGGLLAKIFKKKLIITTYGSDINIWIHEPIKSRRIIRSLRNCHKIISVSQALQQKMIQFKIAENKIEVIHQGIDLNYFRPMDKNAVRKKLNLPKNKKIILCIADFFPIKGHENLIKAISLIRNRQDILVLLIGDGPMRNNIKQQIIIKKISVVINMVGKKEHKEIPSWINASDVVVLPSHNEGLPTVVLESFACGKPIVANKVGGIPEKINGSDNGILVESCNVYELARALSKALDQKWDSQKIAQHSQDYSWGKISNKILEEYEKTLANGH